MNCLRCGRATKASFCPECLKTVSLPLVESPYLNTQINLNAKKAHRSSTSGQTVSKEKKSHSHKGYIITIVILSILCTALLCACLWLLWGEFL